VTHWLGRASRLTPQARNAFGVVSIETTGLFPAYHDRIIEIAVVNVDDDRVTDEWVTLVNPERDIGPTRVHGISARQVVAAPTFQFIAGDLVERLADRVLVGHNGRFQGDFIEYEMGRMGHRVDCTQILCTMTLAQGLGVSGRSLYACCESLGLRGNSRHDALSDARATAGLLMALLARARREGIEVEVPEVLARTTLPDVASSGRVVHRGESEAPLVSALAALIDRLPVDALSGESSREAVLAYVGLLDRALEDRRLDAGELGALGDVAVQWGLSANAVASIHARYFAGLRQLALADGQLTDAEREDLAVMGALLGAGNDPAIDVEATPIAVADRRTEFVGKTVCFTGSSVCSIDGVPLDRATQEMLAAEAGLVPLDGVTKKLDLLVLADAASSSGKARKAREYGTRLVAERAFWAALGVHVD